MAIFNSIQNIERILVRLEEKLIKPVSTPVTFPTYIRPSSSANVRIFAEPQPGCEPQQLQIWSTRFNPNGNWDFMVRIPENLVPTPSGGSFWKREWGSLSEFHEHVVNWLNDTAKILGLTLGDHLGGTPDAAQRLKEDRNYLKESAERLQQEVNQLRKKLNEARMDLNAFCEANIGLRRELDKTRDQKQVV